MAERRKLAAILAADVVGFSRLTGADEDRTLARLRALRSDLIDPTIAVHNGRVVKRTGDGALVEFRSVVDAVRCAIEVQNAHGRAQRRPAAGAPHRVPHRHSSRRCRRGERRRPDGRWRQHRRAIGGCRRARRHLSVRGRLSAGEGEARSRGQRSRSTPSSRTSPNRCGSIRWQVGVPAKAKPVTHGESMPPSAPAAALSVARQAFDCRAAVHEYVGRSGTGVFRRRNGRRHHHRPLPIQSAVRDRAKFDLYLQGPGGGRASGGQGTGCALRAGGRRPQIGKSVAHHGPADRCGDRRPSVGGQVRRRPGRCLRSAGQDHRERGRRHRTDDA